jgi:hypothetical protein
MIVFFLENIARWLLWKYEHNIPEIRKTCAFSVLNVKVSAVLRVENYMNAGYVSKMEADTHADTTVAGKNCVAMHFTERSCGVQPYSDEYEPIPDVPIVTAATGFTSKNGMNYILVFPEALYMPNLDHSLFNPNQLRHFGTVVQDNPYDAEPMCIKSADNTFTACLDSVGTDIFLKTWAPSDADLKTYPHVVLSSNAQWSPKLVRFPGTSHLDQAEIESRNVCGVQTMEECLRDRKVGHEMKEDLIFSIDELRTSIISSARVTYEDLQARIISQLRFKELPPPVLPGPIEERDIKAPYTFLSEDRHSNTTPVDLSERWGLSVAQAALTLKATTRHLLRSALMPLARRYRADRMFQVPRLEGTWATDTMDMRCNSIHGERYCQVYANKMFFAEAYPVPKKSDCHETLDSFVNDYGAMDLLISDGSAEQCGPGTEFQKKVQKYQIQHKRSEKERPNQNPAEGVIREVRKKWYRTMFKTNCPKRLWTYGVPYVCALMRMTASYAGRLQGRTPIEAVLGETPDISEYLDFGFYDWVWFKRDAGIGEIEIGKWLGVSKSTGSLMSYYVLPITGVPVSRTTVQRVTELEKQTDANQQRIAAFDKAIAGRFHEGRLVTTGGKPDLAAWSELLETDPDFAEEFAQTFDNPDVPEADDEFDPDSFDSYLNMELALDRDDTTPELAKVTKRMKDAAGNPIGTANDNPILDTRLYEVEYLDGHKAAMAANVIAENILAQVDHDGHRRMLFEAIIDHRNDGTELQEGEASIKNSSGMTRNIETTKGWECLIQWHDGSTTWNKMKDIKDSYPVQLAEYAVENKLEREPAFRWWVAYVLKKRDRIIKKVKSSYWAKTHKYGFEVPKTYLDCIRIDNENKDTQWQDAVRKEMKTVRPAFEIHEGEIKALVGYQQIKCQFVFDVKLGEGFRKKARLVALGNRTQTPATLTYSSVVSRDSVRIALTVAALNELDILVCDIEGAYLTAKCREKVWVEAGPEFGSEVGKIMIVKMALYGLKSSGAAFRSKLAGVLHDMNYRPSLADPDVWLRAATKPCGFEYYEMVLCYVDDVMVVGHEPGRTIDGIQAVFKLKGDKAAAPDMYLGVTLEKKPNSKGVECWTMSPEKYVKAAIENVEKKLGGELPFSKGQCPTPMRTDYHPAEDTSAELDTEGLGYYQELIGVLRWAVEIGRLDILLEISLLSSHLALPREGHLEQVYHIFAYLKHGSRRRIYLDPSYPSISESRFQSYDWTDFYKYAEEPMPSNMPTARGRVMSTHCFVDSDHAGDKVTRRSQTGILIFCNSAPIMAYSKRQNSVEGSTYGSELVAMRQAIDLVKGLRYKLRMFGIPIEGPTDVFCDNESVFKNVSVPESVLSKKQHSISYHAAREAVAAGVVRIAKENTLTNLSDVFTKMLNKPKREGLLDKFMY